MSTYQHILISTDLHTSSAYVVEKGMALAGALDAKVTLMHVVEPIPAYGFPEVAELESPYIEQAKQALVKQGTQFNIPAEDHLMEFGTVKMELLKAAEKLGVDLIVIGSHGRHGLVKLLGSTASGVVHGAECDVLTVRYAE